MIYTSEKIKRHIDRLTDLYGKDLTASDLCEVIPQEMELIEVATEEPNSGKEQSEIINEIICQLIDNAETELDKETLKKLVPYIIEVIAKGSKLYYAINRQVGD